MKRKVLFLWLCIPGLFILLALIGWKAWIFHFRSPRLGIEHVDLNILKTLEIRNLGGRPGEPFYDITDIAVDDEENIYLLEKYEKRIVVYDPQGKCLLSFGREGQGPGEFQNPTRIYLDNQRYLFVKDVRKIHIFQANGSYHRDARFEFYTNDHFIEGYHTFEFAVFHERDIFATIIQISEESSMATNALIRYNLQTETVDVVKKLPAQNIKVKGSIEFGGAMGGVNKPGDIRILIAACSSSELAYGLNDKEELRLLDVKSGRIRTFALRLPRARTEGARYKKILFSDNGDLWVEVSAERDGTQIPFHIYQQKTRRWCRSELPFSPQIVFKDRIYAIIKEMTSEAVRIERWDIGNKELRRY